MQSPSLRVPRRRLVFAAVAAALAMAFAPLVVAPTSAAEGYTLSGTVTADDGIAPAEGYAVAVFRSDGSGQVGNTGTLDGTYALSGVPDGSYTVYVYPLGTETSPHRLSVTTVEVDGADTVHDVVLFRSGTITGTVYGPEIGGLVVDVTLYPSDFESEAQPLHTIRLDEGGQYQFDDVEPGLYKLAFRSNADSSLALAPHYFNNTATFADAETIAVGSGETVSNIDATLAEPVEVPPDETPLAVLPETDTIAISNYYDFEHQGQLYTVDSVSGEPTPVGPRNEADKVTGLDVDSKGLGYAITLGANYPENDSQGRPKEASKLYRVDLTTGMLTSPVEITNEAGEAVLYCNDLDLAISGLLVAVCDLPEQGNPPFDPRIDDFPSEWSSVGTIDPETGVYTTILTSLPKITALARNPLTGALYGFTRGGQVLALDLIAATVDEVGSTGYTQLVGADFDSSGQLWAIPAAEVPLLASVSTDDWGVTLVGPIVGGESRVGSSESLTIWGTSAAPGPITPDPLPPTPIPPVLIPPAPTTPTTPTLVVPAPVTPAVPSLAATGIDASPLGLAGIVALLLGGGTLLLRRRVSAR